ncbi:glycosyl transferase [Lactococcus hodotermopsidis]|uniref:Glycosyl transferase n=1 Tax=Pseudolactococcus hodotermopsidis TaxID=2709157 RepID=A0A6A0BE72_9LACT|nr:glycosyltransferase family 2 protein [Lactococcus hodotermopsidis]GFH42784.1 glycosyl transferase [Lactococcus hodotermopsidis]
MTQPTLTLIIPAYNEAEVLPETIRELTPILTQMIDSQKISPNSKILFVNDGSKDQTWELITTAQVLNPMISGLSFSRNYGHQNALVAGLTTALSTSDIMVTIDADLQDDIDVIPQMVDEFLSGSDIVYGVRDNRTTDSAFKRTTAQTFYNIMHFLGVDMIPDSADFRLMSKRAVAAFLEFDERNLFIRGIVPLVGFPSSKVYYKRNKRFAGVSKYPLRKMVKFALDGITSFSIAPVRFLLILGSFSMLIGLLMFIYVLYCVVTQHVVRGWASTITSLWLLSGIQLLAIGIIGEYIGKIFTEVKHRPRFIIEEDTFSSDTFE